MTKEENLNKEFGRYISASPSMLTAMDRFAEQQAIAFAKWTAEGLWTVYGENWYPYRDNDNPITAQQLYQLFLQSQTPNP